MARRNSNIGWKIFGIVILAIVLAVAFTALAVWIGSAINHIEFAEQFKNWFPFFYNTATENSEVVATSLFIK